MIAPTAPIPMSDNKEGSGKVGVWRAKAGTENILNKPSNKRFIVYGGFMRLSDCLFSFIAIFSSVMTGL